MSIASVAVLGDSVHIMITFFRRLVQVVPWKWKHSWQVEDKEPVPQHCPNLSCTMFEVVLLAKESHMVKPSCNG